MRVILNAAKTKTQAVEAWVFLEPIKITFQRHILSGYLYKTSSLYKDKSLKSRIE